MKPIMKLSRPHEGFAVIHAASREELEEYLTINQENIPPRNMAAFYSKNDAALDAFAKLRFKYVEALLIARQNHLTRTGIVYHFKNIFAKWKGVV